MPEKILMIALSPTMETGTVARWRKKEGDTIASGDVLCEVETDKATMDYESSAEGTLLKILLPEGGQAKVGDVIAIVGKPGEDISGIVAGLGSGSSGEHAIGPVARRGRVPGTAGCACAGSRPRRPETVGRRRPPHREGSSPRLLPAKLRPRRASTSGHWSARALMEES